MGKRQEIDNNSLSKIIAEKITEQIITGELQPGEKIVETVYADEYGTSRAPIREALYLLTIEGLVERVPRKGAVVKGYTNFEMYDLLEIRMMLEDLTMRRIRETGIVVELVDEMEKLIPFMEEAKSHEEYATLNHQFHSLIVKMSQSEVIMNMYARLGLPLLTLQTMSFLEERYILKSLQEHRLIIEMLKINRFDKAHEILQKHNQDVIGRVENTIAEKKRED
ncbi:MAG TPA: GntR family transcriptional regulator [Bacillales bacterium]|nr:GntR family transcriptional regulator [Bacillales bacterium]